MLKKDELEKMEGLKKEIVGNLRKLPPDDVESIIIAIIEDLWDEAEMSTDPILIKAYNIIDGYISGERVVRWDELTDAVATLEAYRRVKRREPIVSTEF